jgi:class 3 adenylate cyclase
VAITCARCEAEAADGDRFCSSCGGALEQGSASERKVATMVFADLVGSTEMASGLDPEDMKGKLEPFFEVARQTLEEHGGTLEKYIGDAVLAVFGVPIAHGDDPDRAVTAALALLERVEALGTGLALRVGIETGEVLAADRDGDLSVTGEAVNVAARLQQAASPGEVLVGERAGRSCRRVLLKPGPTVEAKGLDRPLATLRAAAMNGQPDTSVTPFVGRGDDLELLRLIYRRAARERAPELVTIIGEAGIGKTRLASELTEELRDGPDPPRVLIGRNPPYGRGIALWALAEILRDAAGMPEEAPVGEVEQSLGSLLAGLGADDAGEIAASLTLALRGAEEDREARAEEELRRSWRRFVGLLAAERPLVIGIDDAHWADDGLLDLVEEVVFGLGEAPLLLLCTSRPELLERRPDFGRAIGNVSQIELRPLDPEATRALAEQLLPAESKSLAAEVAAASGGNPFFAEEVSCALREGNGDGALPDTVQATIAGRIDLLPANEKRVLQHAAVLGHSFGDERLTSLLGSAPRPELTELARKALVVEHAERGPGHFAFRHQLIRDVAYSSLPRRERVLLHERAAGEIATHAGGRFAELAELRAFHLSEAAALEPSPERSERACEALLEAAEIAVRRGAGGRALELYEQAAGLAEAPAQRAAILKTGAEVALRRWAGQPAMQMLRAAASTWESAGEAKQAATVYARMVEVLTRFGGISGEGTEEQIASLNARARELADPNDEATQTRLRLNDAWIPWRFDREGEMEEPAKEGLEMARRAGDPALISAALDAVQGPQWYSGQHSKAVDTARERLELIDANPSSPTLDVERSDALHMMVESLMQVGSFREAADFAAAARRLDTGKGIAYTAWEREMLPAFYLGEWDEVLETTVRFREEWIAAGKPPLAAMAAAVASAGAIHGYRGDERAAEEWFAFGEQVAPDISGQLPGITVWRADVDLHHGRLDAAAERLAGAAESFWWRAAFHGAKAEAFARAGSDTAGETIETARTFVGENRYAQGLMRRAEGIYHGDQELLGSALELFEEIECPYQAARSGWLIGGQARERARTTFEALGAVEPAG